MPRARPRQGKKYANASNGKCTYVHLDTRRRDDAKRFKGAQKAFQKKSVRLARKSGM